MKRPWQHFYGRCRDCAASTFLSNLPQHSAKAAFEFLSPSTRLEYNAVAWEEVARYLYYFEIMASESKPDLWSTLSESEQEDFTPYDVQGFLRSQVDKVRELRTEFRFGMEESASDVTTAPASAQHVLKVLCDKNPSVLRDSLAQLRAFYGLAKKEEPGIKAEPPASELSLEACKDIASSLVRPYVQQNLRYGEQSHWGSLLHYLVWLAQDNFGDSWPNKVIIASSSTLDLLDVMQLQAQAQGMGVVLSTDTHWSLLCIRMGTPAAYLYDGLGCKKTWELAEAVMSHVNERQKGAAAVVRGDFPRQEDGWSCGHRLVMAFQYFVCSFADGIWPPAMPASEFTLEAIRDFCEGQDEPEEADEEDRPPLSKKPRLGSSGAAAASGPVVPAEDSKADGNPALKKRRKLSQKQQDDLDAQKGRDLFTAKQMSYEKHFQSAHHSEKQPMGKGHWRVFLLALARDNRLKCKTCSGLRDMVLLPEPSQGSQQLVPTQQTDAKVYSGTQLEAVLEGGCRETFAASGGRYEDDLEILPGRRRACSADACRHLALPSV